eukprot:gnl/MRDRNA2_/MRDRNA2_87673_c0_seq1.p1 gnl/MRDRNA2_/MRDRNA2_87673_c0~~gnl/MRDRNA2_/MRDRNA2_87673_c0_seq1.p1  ORF type:complete len:1288 (-),score=286.59 gnl/MRDRNA2_/MRDRNA2_87673_c0_seq1:202-4065(-)
MSYQMQSPVNRGVESPKVSLKHALEVVKEEGKPCEEKITMISPWKLFQYRKAQDTFLITIGAFFAMVQGSAMPVFTIILGDATDMMGGFEEGETFMSKMERPLVYMTILMVVVGFCGFIQSAAFHRSSERQGACIRYAYLNAALQRDQAWYDENDGAALPTRMQTEVQKVQDAIGQKFGLLLVPLGQFIAGLVVGLYYGWKLTLVIMCFLPFMGLSATLLASSATKEANQTWYARAGAAAEEVIFSLRTVAAFGGERQEIERYERHLNGAMNGSIRCGVENALAFAWLFFVFGCSYAVCFWFCADYMMGPDGDFSTGGDVIMCFFSAIIGVSGVSDAAMPINTFIAGLAAGTNMFKLIDETSSIEHGGDDGVLSNIEAINELKFENVSFTYPSRQDVQVLKGISFSIHKSQKVAFVGESGSGKSTIVQLLERFYDPQGGSILVNGMNLTHMPVYAWRRLVGYVGQEPVLFATTVLENIRMSCPEASESDCRAAAKQAEALAFLDKMPQGLQTYVGQGGGQLSGGQKQRIAIARALVKKPILLILDEATSALDNESEKLVQQTLDGLQQHGDLTIVTIAHRLSTVRNSDKIFVLSQGHLTESGTHQELVDKKGVYFKLTEAQAAADGVGAEGGEENPHQLVATKKSGTNSTLRDDEAQVDRIEGKSEEEREKERLKELEKWNPPLRRIFTFADPIVKLMWPVALLACLVDGCAMPLQGWVLSEAMFDFFLPYQCPPPDNDPLQAYQCENYEPAGTESPLKREAYKNALLFLGLAILQFVGIFMKQSIYRWIQERMTKNLRKEYFTCLLSQEIGFFDDPANSAGGLTAALAKQTQLVAGITGISLGQMIGSTCALLLGVAMAFVACWRLALAMLGAVPLVGIAMALVTKMMYAEAGAGGQGAYSESGAIASEAVLNIKTVRACRAEKQVLSRFNSKLQAIVKKKTSESAKSGFAYGFGMAIIFVLYVICFSYGPYNVDEGFCDGEDMFKALFCMMFGAMGAGMGAIFMQDADKAKLAAYDMLTIMDRESKVNALNPIGCTAVHNHDPFIVFKNVSFFYPHRPEMQVLNDFSVNVLEGQTVALVGPSGSGKSTIVQLLMRFYDVAQGSGSITVGGTDLRSFNVSWWRSNIGFVGQEPVLFDTSLEDNMKYGKADATRAELEEAAALANMDFLLSGKVQWADSVGPRGGKLSGGQKQRVAIARALLRKPKILLLDEATSALDSTSEHVVQEALDTARRGRTTFVVAHRLSTIQDSDLILVMCDGTVTEQGTHEQLLVKQGLYWTLQHKSAA